MHRDITRRRVLIGGVVVLLRPRALIGDDMPAKITLTPSTAAPGTTIQVKGTGFGWRWWATVTLDGAQVAKVQGSTAGNFTTTFVAAGTVGAHVVKAKTAYRSATATLTLTGITPPPDPPPDPPPAGGPLRPEPPVTTRTVTVPASVTNLNAFIADKAKVPDGSIVECPATGDYSVLLFQGRKNLDVRGNGAKLRQTGPGSVQESTAILLKGSDHIRIGGFKIIGNNPNTTNIFVGGNENSHAFATGGWGGGPRSTNVELYDIDAEHIYGDFAYLEGQNAASFDPSDRIWIHHVTGKWIGRNAVSYINVMNVTVTDHAFDKVGMDIFDIEQNFTAEEVRFCLAERGTIGSYGHMSQFLGWFVRNWNPPGNAPTEDFTVRKHTVVGNPAMGYAGSAGNHPPAGLNTRFDTPSKKIVVEDNSTQQPVGGPVLVFANVSGLTVRRNTQPLTSGSLTSFSNCQNVVTS